MSDRRSGGGGAGAGFALLIFIGFIVKFWVYIVAVLGALVLVGLLWWWASCMDRRAKARENTRLAIVARADQQHAWVLAGDDRGIYGEFAPARI
jgi:ABC-type protease/lipase transport system fused ATPase/permease subunit